VIRAWLAWALLPRWLKRQITDAFDDQEAWIEHRATCAQQWVKEDR
jgi:hypothetical protein